MPERITKQVAEIMGYTPIIEATREALKAKEEGISVGIERLARAMFLGEKEEYGGSLIENYLTILSAYAAKEAGGQDLTMDEQITKRALNRMFKSARHAGIVFIGIDEDQVRQTRIPFDPRKHHTDDRVRAGDLVDIIRPEIRVGREKRVCEAIVKRSKE